VPSSKRFIGPGRASEIISLIRDKVKIVGIFQDAEIKYVNEITFRLGLDLVQLHGNESEEYCRKVEAPVIKVFQLPVNFSVINTFGTMSCYSIPLYMVDRKKRGEGGIIDLKKGEELAQRLPLFFSGGLTPENVAGIIQTVNPFAVDVAGGVETDGKQDIHKIAMFIKNAKGGVV
jgi:phosphoribosylanthranilate isomerase